MRGWRSAPVLLLALLLAGPALADDQGQLRTLKRKIGQLEQQLGSIRGQRSDAEKALARLEPELGRLHRALADLDRQIKAGGRELSALEQQQRSLQQQRTRQAQQLGELLRGSYRNGQESWLKLLLNQQEPDQLSRQLIYYDYLARARGDALAQYSRTLADLAAVQQRLHARQLELSQQRSAFAQQQQALALQQQQRRQVLKDLDARLRKEGRSLSSLRAQRQELEQVLETVANIDLGVTGQPFAKSRGQLPWPVKGKLLARYGDAHSGVPLKGMLIAAPAGTPIRSIHHGQVVFANWLRGYGLVLIVDHGNEYLSLYAHNQSLARSVGDWVQPGDLLARVGDTGGSGQSALYFEMRRKGRPYNPQPWLGRG